MGWRPTGKTFLCFWGKKSRYREHVNRVTWKNHLHQNVTRAWIIRYFCCVDIWYWDDLLMDNTTWFSFWRQKNWPRVEMRDLARARWQIQVNLKEDYKIEFLFWLLAAFIDGWRSYFKWFWHKSDLILVLVDMGGIVCVVNVSIMQTLDTNGTLKSTQEHGKNRPRNHILVMLESSGFRKYGTLLVIQLFSRRLCLCHCLCIRPCLCICVPYSFLNSYYHKLSENVWVWGSGASRSGGGEDVTIAGRTNKQGKIELLSHYRPWKAEMSNISVK